jgi:hypothetical protein
VISGLNLRDGLYAIRSLAHHLDTAHKIQQRHQSQSHHVVILDDRHTNQLFGNSLLRAHFVSLLAPAHASFLLVAHA